MIFHFSRSDDEAKGAINYISSFIAEENRIHSLQIIHIQHIAQKFHTKTTQALCFFITTEHCLHWSCSEFFPPRVLIMNFIDKKFSGHFQIITNTTQELLFMASEILSFLLS